MRDEIKKTPFEDLLSIKVLQKMLRLENRIEELEAINEEHRELNGKLRNGYCEIKEKCNKGECDCTNEEYESMAQANMKLRLLLDDYKTRNEKAINCINHYATENDDYSKLYSTEEEELLEILQGSDE